MRDGRKIFFFRIHYPLFIIFPTFEQLLRKKHMKLSQSSLSLLEGTINKAINKYAYGCEQTIVTDIHLQPNQNSGELSIFDDEDEELANVTIEE